MTRDDTYFFFRKFKNPIGPLLDMASDFHRGMRCSGINMICDSLAHVNPTAEWEERAAKGSGYKWKR